EEAGLARAVAPEQPVDPVRLQRKRQAIDGGDILVGQLQVGHVDTQCHWSSSCASCSIRRTTSSTGIPIALASATIGSTISAKKRSRCWARRASREPGVTNIPIPRFL